MSERVVLGSKGASSMIKIRWTDKIPGNINDVEDALEMGPAGHQETTYQRRSATDRMCST